VVAGEAGATAVVATEVEPMAVAAKGVAVRVAAGRAVASARRWVWSAT